MKPKLRAELSIPAQAGVVAALAGGLLGSVKLMMMFGLLWGVLGTMATAALVPLFFAKFVMPAADSSIEKQGRKRFLRDGDQKRLLPSADRDEKDRG